MGETATLTAIADCALATAAARFESRFRVELDRGLNGRTYAFPAHILNTYAMSRKEKRRLSLQEAVVGHCTVRLSTASDVVALKHMRR